MTFGQLTNILLYEKENFGALYECVHLLHDFYAGITGITAEQTTDKNIHLPSGKAISPGQAAHCLLDIQRTTKFMRGVHKAILQLQQDFPGEPINILYAGCGPYATLLTPLTTMFTPQQVRYHMLDVQQDSLDAVRKLYEHMQATDYIAAFINHDAATYRMEKPMHLVVCEAMQSALDKEPQVAITLNLGPQLKPGGIFIPQEIRVSAHLLDRQGEIGGFYEGSAKPDRIVLGDVYMLGQASGDAHQPVSLSVPPSVGACNELFLLTDITVFADERLTIYNCGLTLPRKVADVSGGEAVKVEYKMGERPGFVSTLA